jgi:hypothetical protein
MPRVKKLSTNDLMQAEIKKEMQVSPPQNVESPQFDNSFNQEYHAGDMNRQQVLPESDLELTYNFTVPKWGNESANPELKSRFRHDFVNTIPMGQKFKDDDGVVKISDGERKFMDSRDHWGEMNFITQDLPLGNYDRPTYDYCAYFWELGGDYLKGDGKKISYPIASALAIQKGAIHGSMSLGRGGFLRKMQNTLIKKEEFSQMEVKKNNILGGKPKDQQYYG